MKSSTDKRNGAGSNAKGRGVGFENVQNSLHSPVISSDKMVSPELNLLKMVGKSKKCRFSDEFLK